MSKRDRKRFVRKALKAVRQGNISQSHAALTMQTFRSLILSILDKRVSICDSVTCPFWMLI